MPRSLSALTILLLALFLAACSGVEIKRGEQARNNRDIPQGPGMLTGSGGEFVIFRVDDGEVPPEDETSGEQDASQSAPAQEGAPQ